MPSPKEQAFLASAVDDTSKLDKCIFSDSKVYKSHDLVVAHIPNPLLKEVFMKEFGACVYKFFKYDCIILLHPTTFQRNVYYLILMRSKIMMSFIAAFNMCGNAIEMSREHTDWMLNPTNFCMQCLVLQDPQQDNMLLAFSSRTHTRVLQDGVR